MRVHVPLAVLTALGPVAMTGALPTAAVAATTGQAAQAQAAYKLGVQAFKQQDYNEALARFEEAYALDPSPILLYNMARANEELGRPAQAVERYEAYLEAAPQTEDRADIEQRIRIMRAILANVEEPDNAPLGLVADSAEVPVMRPIAYGTLAGGAVMILVAIIGVAQLESARDAYLRADTVRKKQTAEDDGESAAILANVGWVTGALLLGTGGLLLGLAPAPESGPPGEPTAPAPAPAGGAGFYLGWQFTW